MSSVRKIAAKVGVSVATVSRALNNSPHIDPATRDRVLRAANQTGYSHSVGRRVTTVIGLAYPGDPERGDHGGFDAALVAGILRAAGEANFSVHILSLEHGKTSRENFSQFFARKGVRGAILRTFSDTRDVCEQIASEAFASVVVADRFDKPNVNFIWSDSRPTCREAIEQLIDLGHRRIGLAVHKVPDTDHMERRLAWEEAHRSRGLTPDPSLVQEIFASMDGGAQAISAFMSMDRPPTAVFLTDPLSTYGAMRRCLELGLMVPRDLSVIGFDDSDLRRHTYPAFTAVCQDAERMGYEAARWLIGRLQGDAPARIRLSLPTTYDPGRTIGPPRADAVVHPPAAPSPESAPSTSRPNPRAARRRNRGQ